MEQDKASVPWVKPLFSNPLVKGISLVQDRIVLFKEKVKEFYFHILLSQYRCPKCTGELAMTGPSLCACGCGSSLDPTLAFQRSPCCDAKLVRKTSHYACSRCHQTVPSRFLFDERLFDRQYFREMMREARAREKRRQEELKVFLVASKSDTLLLLEEPNLDSVPGLTDALNQFIGIQFDPCDYSSTSRFRMNDYRNHILSVLGIGARLFSDIPSLLEDRRTDRIWRFVTLIFMQQDGEVSLTQYGDDVWVENEAHD